MNDPTPEVPEVSDLEMAFPCAAMKLLPPMSALSQDERSMRGIYCKAATGLFFTGGKLEDHGIQVRDRVDEDKVYRYLGATLRDWTPKHEHKIGGVGHMLAKWCEPVKGGAE